MEKFKSVPIDEDTTIKSAVVISIADTEALHQKWVWDGIIAESLIFVDSDVKNIDDEDLIALAVSNDLIQEGSKTTIRRESSGYTFLNFNFENPI